MGESGKSVKAVVSPGKHTDPFGCCSVSGLVGRTDTVATNEWREEDERSGSRPDEVGVFTREIEAPQPPY